MDVGSVVNQGLIGMQKSQASMAQSAQQIAQAGTTQRADSPQASSQSQDLSEALVNLKAQSQVFDSSAKVVKAADETIGTLLDVRA
jgi:flagellar hook-associated protein FlgK